MTLTAASCFSGIGAPELGGPQFDWKWCAEIEKFPAAVLAERFPHSVNLGDVTADDFLQSASAFGPLDLLVGGPPCQDFSVAGLRAGMAGDRGNLTLRFLEIAHAIRPRNLLVENVPGWLNMPDNAFGSFLGGLVGADDALHSPLDGKWPSVGMVAGPRARAAWRVFDAQYAGVAQRRRRVFVVADFGNGADPAQILFERKSMSGNNPPSRETRKDVAPTIAARTKGGGGLGTDFDLDGGLVEGFTPSAHGDYRRGLGVLRANGGDVGPGSEVLLCVGDGSGVSATVTSKWSKGSGGFAGDEHYNLVAASVPPTLNAAFASKQGLENQHIDGGCGMFVAHGPVTVETADTQGVGSNQTTGFESEVVGEPIAFSSKDYGNDATADMSPTLRSMAHADSHANGGGQVAVAFSENQQANVSESDVIPALNQGGGKPGQSYPDGRVGLDNEWAVRRLTPVECERLQGFPDGFTNITIRGKEAADGPRYKALGNSWAVPCGAWIIDRIAKGLNAIDAERAAV